MGPAKMLLLLFSGHTTPPPMPAPPPADEEFQLEYEGEPIQYGDSEEDRIVYR